jgi:hypothetical protein
MRNAFMRKAVAPQLQGRTQFRPLVAPLNGWITSTSLEKPKKDSAAILQNWFPQRRSIRLRGGSFKHATVSATLACQSLFSYQSGGIEKLFGTTSGAIYNITTPADPDVPPSADVSGQTSGRYSGAHLPNASGDVFLRVVNGTDTSQVYDGAAWSTSPAITGVSSADLSHIWVFGNRFFFVEKDTSNAWYLAVDNIGGAATKFSLAGIFPEGGQLLSGGSWSVDAGDGMHDLCVFISNLGEIAVYQGFDPASWTKVGIYSTGRVLGKNALLKVAGDLLIATADGLVPMSMIKSLDRAALSLNAISWQIEPDWKLEADARNDHWTMVKWPEKQMTIIALPSGASLSNRCFVVNTETGAWAEYTGWDTNCIAMFNRNAYFGTSAGTVMLAESGGSDDGENYVSSYLGQFEDWGESGATKVAQLMRSTFLASNPFTPKVGVKANYNASLPSPPSVAAETPGDLWDVGLWDTALWDAEGVATVTTRWRSVSGVGHMLAPFVMVTSGGVNTPDAQLISNHVKFGVGAEVT